MRILKPSKPPRSILGLFNAVTIGLLLGFVAVMLWPRLLVAYNADGAAQEARADLGALDLASKEASPSAGEEGAPAAKSRDDETAAQQSLREEPAPAAAPQPRLVPAFKAAFPKPFSDEDMTAALNPLLSLKVSDSDAAALKLLIAAVQKNNGDAASDALKKVTDPAARTFGEWKRLRRYDADFEQALAFSHTHPLFPAPVQDASSERSLFLSNAPAGDVLRFFSSRTPLTSAGTASYAGALIESGQRERGLRLVKQVWKRYPMDPAVQERFSARFGSLLDDGDRHNRALLLAARERLKDDVKTGAPVRAVKASARAKVGSVNPRTFRAAPGRRGYRRYSRSRGRRVEAAPATQEQVASAIGVSPLRGPSSLVARVQLKPGAQPAAAAAQPAQPGAASKPDAANKPEPAKKNSRQAKAAESAINLVDEVDLPPASLLAKLRLLRRHNADDDVWSLLRSVDPDKADLAEPDRWWAFRRAEVRRALDEERPRTAYGIASVHGPLDDEELSEAEFLAGWIALEFLHDAKLAVPHFRASLEAKGIVRDEARAAYWLGRAQLALGDRRAAEASLAEAATRFYTYYGSLAREALRKAAACEFRAPPNPSPEAVAAFVNEPAFKAVVIIKQLDMEPLLVGFLLDLARQVDDPEQAVLLLELVERTAPAHVAVRTAKILLLRGFPVEAYAFPTLLPKFDPLGGSGKIEPALLNALTRQESEFHTASVSRVGARGLMQLMPQTARLVAGSNKIKYDLPRLINDPSYNVTLGSAFLASLLDGYNGSYVLALAAYNAGPGRVSQWIDAFGDPRDKAVDPIDWVERIPIAETKNYVQRILESLELYRCRFANGSGTFQILEDLHRGRPGKLPDFGDFSGSGDLDLTP